jgi:hypothetical protein
MAVSQEKAKKRIAEICDLAREITTIALEQNTKPEIFYLSLLMAVDATEDIFGGEKVQRLQKVYNKLFGELKN